MVHVAHSILHVAVACCVVHVARSMLHVACHMPGNAAASSAAVVPSTDFFNEFEEEEKFLELFETLLFDKRGAAFLGL